MSLPSPGRVFSEIETAGTPSRWLLANDVDQDALRRSLRVILVIIDASTTSSVPSGW